MNGDTPTNCEAAVDISPLRLPPGTSESGYVGVYRQWASWKGEVHIDGRSRYLGSRPTPEAAAVLVAAELSERYGPEWRLYVNRTAARRGPARKITDVPWTPELDAQLLQIAATGAAVKGPNGIAARMGINRFAVTNRLRRLADPADRLSPLYPPERKAVPGDTPPQADEPPPDPVGRLTREEVAAELVKWKRLIYQTANRLARKYGLDVDDVAAEIQAGWIDAATRFSKNHGWKFNTYAHACGEGFALKYCQAERFRGLHIPGETKGIPSPVFLRVTTARGVEDDPGVIVADHRREPSMDYDPGWWDEVLGDLPPFDRAVVEFHFRDREGVGEIAERFGVGRDEIRDVLGRALAAVRAAKPHLERGLAG